MMPTDERVLNKEWLRKVAGTADIDLRAHRVALTYHYFARKLDAWINGGNSVWSRLDDQKSVETSNANWFNFAIWATVTINRDIDPRRSPADSLRFMPATLRRSLTPTIMHLRAADGQRVSRALSWGQRLVFLSTTFTFYTIFSAQEQPESELPATLVKEAAWPEILHLATWDDQQYLGKRRHLSVVLDAFDAYRRAGQAAQELARLKSVNDTDPRASRLQAIRARNILQGNLMITAVEQDVVQGAVSEVINHVPKLTISAVADRMARWGERFLGVPHQITGIDLRTQLEPTADVLMSIWARLMSQQILVLMLPTEILRLGRDIPALEASQPYFPPQLADLTALPDGGPASDGTKTVRNKDENAQNDDLLKLVESFDRSLGDGRGSAARDWRQYASRMNWAVNLLRSRQQDLSLYWCPYSEPDQDRIINGELPYRGGDPSRFEVQAPLEGLPLHINDD